MTVASFVGLAEGTIENKALPPGTPFFHGTVFHRVVPSHVIQEGQAKGSGTRALKPNGLKAINDLFDRSFE